MKFNKVYLITLGIFVLFVNFITAHTGEDFYMHHDMMSWSSGTMWEAGFGG